MTNKIAVATMTLDKPGNGEEMLEALSNLSKYKVFVSDGGSSKDFVNSLCKMGFFVESAFGLAAQHRNVFLRAGNYVGNGLVIYTEPDKKQFFKEGLEKSISDFNDNNLDFAVVSRRDEILNTFPESYRLTEGAVNAYMAHVLGFEKFDGIYGPKLFRGDFAVKEISRKQAEKLQGWQTLMYLIARAHKTKLNISQLPYAAPFPESQRAEENIEYRIKQAKDNLIGFQIGLEE